MLIYFGRATKKRILMISSLFLVLVGARLGFVAQGVDLGVSAPVSPTDHIDTGENHVALVVDVTAGGSSELAATESMLQTLDVKATWFLSTTLAETYPEDARRLVEEGHEIGLRGGDNKRIDNLPEAEIRLRIGRDEEALRGIGVEHVPFILPPALRHSDRLSGIAFEAGYLPVKPKFDLGRMKGKEAAAAHKLVESICPGDILVLHIDKKGMVPAERYVRALLDALTEKGLLVVTLGTLAKGVQ